MSFHIIFGVIRANIGTVDNRLVIIYFIKVKIDLGVQK